MSKSVEKITHKELLTFSNLTNLKWEFVDLEGIKEGRRVGEEGGQTNSTQLKDLLAPEMFVRVRKDKNGNEIRENVYDEGEEGLQEMRRYAGIAMEYLEKMGAGNKEGEFLKDWEVIYGGDNYKLTV
jgi:hypothetical protein